MSPGASQDPHPGPGLPGKPAPWTNMPTATGKAPLAFWGPRLALPYKALTSECEQKQTPEPRLLPQDLLGAQTVQEKWGTHHPQFSAV